MILIPAYGRDYRARWEVMEDWQNDKDFIHVSNDPTERDLPINRSDIEGDEYTGYVNIRYWRLRKVVVMKLEGGVKV